ncbi:unnamed protein product [Calicophoron daubneyi]|uniref:Uncharacterized protein n=1 Tax=Calicophoron daubneyi TaxID=300641 RepID=A0AAV2T5M5_CALDB
MPEDHDSEERYLRKLIEEKANKTIEEMQKARENADKDLSDCKAFVLEQITSLFEEIHEDRKIKESATDEAVQQALIQLMSMLERIDDLIGEIETCKSTIEKLNSLLLKGEKEA